MRSELVIDNRQVTDDGPARAAVQPGNLNTFKLCAQVGAVVFCAAAWVYLLRLIF